MSFLFLFFFIIFFGGCDGAERGGGEPEWTFKPETPASLFSPCFVVVVVVVCLFFSLRHRHLQH